MSTVTIEIKTSKIWTPDDENWIGNPETGQMKPGFLTCTDVNGGLSEEAFQIVDGVGVVMGVGAMVVVFITVTPIVRAFMSIGVMLIVF